MRYVGRTLYITTALLFTTPVVAQVGGTGNSVNPTPGAVWTYLGPTIGADWSVGTGIYGPGSTTVNELAVWNNTLGTLLRNGGAVTHTGTIDSNATASLGVGHRGLFNGYPQNLSSMQDTTLPGFLGFTQYSTINTEIDQTVPGGFTISGGIHVPFMSDVQLTGNTTFAGGNNRQESFVGGWLTSGTSFNCGGAVSPGVSACKTYGAAITTGLNTGATGFLGTVGAEIDTFIASGASADFRVGLNIVDLAGVNRGGLYDAAIMIGALAGSVGHFYGIDFGSSLNGIQGVSTNGTLLGADMAYSVLNLIDFHNVSCTGTAIQIATGLTTLGCTGALAVKTATTNPALSVSTTGAADSVISLINSAGGNQDLIKFIEGASTDKWWLGKGADQSFYLKDVVNGPNDLAMSITATGLMTLGETAAGAGNQLILSRAGAAQLTKLPASPGGKRILCIDNATGALSISSAVPAC